MPIHSFPVPHFLLANTQPRKEIYSNNIDAGVITDTIISSNKLVIGGAIGGANNSTNSCVINYVLDDVIDCLSVSKHNLKTDSKVGLVSLDTFKLLLDGAINYITGGADIYIYFTLQLVGTEQHL